MQDWLNRIGLTLQFVALYLVTPEILGESKLERMADTTWIRPLVRALDLVRTHKRLRLFLQTAFVSATIAAGALILRGPIAHHTVTDKEVGAVSAVVAVSTPYIFERIGRLTKALVESKRSFLPIGALIFTLGFVLLMWATFVHSS